MVDDRQDAGADFSSASSDFKPLGAFFCPFNPFREPELSAPSFGKNVFQANSISYKTFKNRKLNFTSCCLQTDLGATSATRTRGLPPFERRGRFASETKRSENFACERFSFRGSAAK